MKMFRLSALAFCFLLSCQKSDVKPATPEATQRNFSFKKSDHSQRITNPFWQPTLVDVYVATTTTATSAVSQTTRATFTSVGFEPVTANINVSALNSYTNVISVYDENMVLFAKVTINNSAQTVQTETFASRTITGKISLGQATANCITDLYSNHGWKSVGMWVMTALVPETMIPVLAHCISYNMFNKR